MAEAMTQLDAIMADLRNLLAGSLSREEEQDRRIAALEKELREVKKVAEEQEALLRLLKPLVSERAQQTAQLPSEPHSAHAAESGPASTQAHNTLPASRDPTARMVTRALLRSLFGSVALRLTAAVEPVEPSPPAKVAKGWEQVRGKELAGAEGTPVTLLTTRTVNSWAASKKEAGETPTLTRWRCVSSQGVDIRKGPSFKRECSNGLLCKDEKFDVSEEKPFKEGTGCFLRLADGRGWGPSRGRAFELCKPEAPQDDPWALWRVTKAASNSWHGRDSWSGWSGWSGSDWSWNKEKKYF